MQNRQISAAEKRLDEILENWKMPGFSYADLLSALLADNQLDKNLNGNDANIIFRTEGIPARKLTGLMGAIHCVTNSKAFKKDENLQRMAVELLTATTTYRKFTSNIGALALRSRNTNEELRALYAETLFNVLDICKMKASDYVTLLGLPNLESNRSRNSLPVLLAHYNDRRNLEIYFNTLSRLIDEEKIDRKSYAVLHKGFAANKLANKVIGAYLHFPERGEQEPSVDAMMSFLSCMAKVQDKFGFTFSDTLDESELGYERTTIPKKAILRQLTDKQLEECSREELLQRLDLLENARDINHPIGCMLAIRRGWLKTDAGTGVRGDAKFAYNRTQKELFFRELDGLSLDQQLKRIHNALKRGTEEYSLLSQPIHLDREYDTPSEGPIRKRLLEKREEITKAIKHGDRYALSPSAPPETIDEINGCHSMIARNLVELYEIARNYNLPGFNRGFKNFVSTNSENDAAFACELFKGNAAREIILARKPELTTKLLETLHSIVADNANNAFEVGVILGKLRQAHNSDIQRNLLHNMFTPTFSSHRSNTSEQLAPALSLLTSLSSESALGVAGMNNLLNFRCNEGGVFAMTVFNSFDERSMLNFIAFLSQLCTNEDSAGEISNMLTARLNKANVFDIMLRRTKNPEVLLAFFMLLDKIVNVHKIDMHLDSFMPDDIFKYGYTIKHDILNYVKERTSKKDCTLYDLQWANRISLMAIDENQPLGKIMHIQRGNTAPTLDTGTLQEFAQLLQETEERIKQYEREFAQGAIIVDAQHSEFNEFEKQPPAYESVVVTPPPVNPISRGREFDTLFNHRYLQRGMQEQEEKVVERLELAVVTETENKTSTPRSTLDIVNGMNTDATDLPQTIKPDEAQVGILVDLSSPFEEAQEENNKYLNQLEDIDFSAQDIEENEATAICMPERMEFKIAEETEEEREARIKKQLEELPQAPTHRIRQEQPAEGNEATTKVLANAK